MCSHFTAAIMLMASFAVEMHLLDVCVSAKGEDNLNFLQFSHTVSFHFKQKIESSKNKEFSSAIRNLLVWSEAPTL